MREYRAIRVEKVRLLTGLGFSAPEIATITNISEHSIRGDRREVTGSAKVLQHHHKRFTKLLRLYAELVTTQKIETLSDWRENDRIRVYAVLEETLHIPAIKEWLRGMDALASILSVPEQHEKKDVLYNFLSAILGRSLIGCGYGSSNFLSGYLRDMHERRIEVPDSLENLRGGLRQRYARACREEIRPTWSPELYAFIWSRVHAALGELDERSRRILELHYNLNGEGHHTFEQIREKLEKMVSRTRVQGIAQRAMHTLRHRNTGFLSKHLPGGEMLFDNDDRVLSACMYALDRVRALEDSLAEAYAQLQTIRPVLTELPYNVLLMLDAASAHRLVENLARSVDELELSVRTYNQLKNAEIKTVGELVQQNEVEMLKSRFFGRKGIHEIKEILASMDLTLGMRLSSEILATVAALRQL